MFKFISKIGLFLVVLAIFLELIFRLVIPASRVPAVIQDQEFKIMKYETAGPTQGLYTSGRRAQHRAHWRVNNLGWISAEDYTLKEDKSLPTAVVIGNSYVEAVYLDADKHLAPVTKKSLGPEVEIFTLGAWGVDLSQEIAVTDYAREMLAPDLVVLVVSHGSLRRSVRNLVKRPFCLQVEFKDDEAVPSLPGTFAPNPLGRLLKNSATFRYIRLNAKFALGGGAQEEAASMKKAVDLGNLTTEEELELGLMGLGARWIVGNLAEKNPDTRFIFLVDADRNLIQAGEKPGPIPASILLQEAVSGYPDFHVLDLTEPLWAEFQMAGQPFQESGNYHWNAYAVEVIASALAGYISEQGLLEVAE